MTKLTPVSGFPEYLPQTQKKFNKLKSILEGVFVSHGFTAIDTPVVEKVSTLLAKGGADHEIYAVSRLAETNLNKNHELALRFDLTVPLARYVAQHYSELYFPFKRYHIAPVWRGERAQSGRYRQFYQCDIDIIGENKLGSKCDLEVLMILYEALSALGLHTFTIKINHKALILAMLKLAGITEETVITEVIKAIDKKQKISTEAFEEELLKWISADSLLVLQEFFNLDHKSPLELIDALKKRLDSSDHTSLVELEDLLTSWSMLGYKPQSLQIDLSLARGLGYYTGIIFETFLNDLPNVGSVASGGRYAHLCSKFINKNLPGIGFSIGLSRLFHVMVENNLVEDIVSDSMSVLVTQQDETCFADYLSIAQQIRTNGYDVELYSDDRPLANQLKYADRKKIHYVVIANRSDRTQDLWILKDMHNSHEQTLSTVQLISFFSSTQDKKG